MWMWIGWIVIGILSVVLRLWPLLALAALMMDLETNPSWARPLLGAVAGAAWLAPLQRAWPTRWRWQMTTLTALCVASAVLAAASATSTSQLLVFSTRVALIAVHLIAVLVLLIIRQPAGRADGYQPLATS